MLAPELKFIVDMDISPLTVSRLKEYGWEILRVKRKFFRLTPFSPVTIYFQVSIFVRDFE